MHTLSIVGVRPQFIKAAPVSRALRRTTREVIVHTGQHYDREMSQIFFDELHIPKPDYNLGIGSGSHGWQTGQMLIHLEEVLLKEQPNWVLVYGDTNSTLAGALAAVKLHMPVAHVEAGLRSFNRAMPEEHNRILTDHAADLLFCPTRQAVELLSREGITDGVHLTGDVMYDAYLYNAQLAEQRSTILSKLGVDPKTYALATVHRPANTDDPDRLRNVLDTLASLETSVVLPAHPRTRQAMKQMGYEPGGNLRVVEPVSYLDMLMLERNALRIFTDSGGVQKEAYFAGVPCITLREDTEWTETLDAGWNVLVGAHPERILESARTFQPPAEHPLLYGDGQASERIAAILRARPG
jgi:UDP-N-acetylglucosamine 2-epimerase